MILYFLLNSNCVKKLTNADTNKEELKKNLQYNFERHILLYINTNLDP
jgi:hypothetical protein